LTQDWIAAHRQKAERKGGKSRRAIRLPGLVTVVENDAYDCQIIIQPPLLSFHAYRRTIIFRTQSEVKLSTKLRFRETNPMSPPFNKDHKSGWPDRESKGFCRAIDRRRVD
jgi:hypothetical protein